MYTSRYFQTEADYTQMRALLIQTFPMSSPPLNLLVGEIDWWRASTNDSDLMNKIRLWFDQAGTLVAFVWPGENKIDVMIHPEHRGIEPEILKKAEAEFSQNQKEKGFQEPKEFEYWSYDEDQFRIRMLQNFGYRRNEQEFLAFHSLRLPANLKTRPLQEGFLIRSFSGESEIENRVEAHRSAFRPSKMTVEKHRKVMASPTYRQDLDIVCVAKNGQIAACTIVWFDEINKVGIFEPVACHSDFQRKGLASAVIHEGIRRLQKMGAKSAIVMSHRDDSPGAQTYQKFGFEVRGRLYQWQKEI